MPRHTRYTSISAPAERPCGVFSSMKMDISTAVTIMNTTSGSKANKPCKMALGSRCNKVQ